MGFVKEFRNIREEMPEWEYIDSLGVVDFRGRKISRHVTNLVVDKENNNYLISQGYTGRRDFDVAKYHYMLCLNGYKLHFEFVEKIIKVGDETFDYMYNIDLIKIIDEEIKKIYTQEKIKKLIKESLEVRSVNKFEKLDTNKNSKAYAKHIYMD